MLNRWDFVSPQISDPTAEPIQLVPRTDIRLRLLSQMHVNFVTVPYFEWELLPTAKAQRLYLAKLLSDKQQELESQRRGRR